MGIWDLFLKEIVLLVINILFIIIILSVMDSTIHHYAQMYVPGYTWWYGYRKTFIHFNQ